ncbi:MAG: hypothetical protein HY361_03170 [Candidatus Aenigmarchaeota archaeon]|nr:hypothetical protein [Candidatus Aenigmarchaeota archaeon]
MPVIGCSIKSIVAERKKSIADIMDINSVTRVISVEEKEIEIASKQSTLLVGFEFDTEYRPEIATIKYIGEVIYATKNEKGILKSWKEDKKLPKDADIEIKNFLLKKCLTLGINISEELQLPPPIVFPAIVPKSEERTK